MVEEKNYHPKFVKYQEEIVKNPAYKGLKITRKDNGELNWVAGKQSAIGRERLDWADKKIKEFHIEGDGPYAKLMFQIHPTKIKVCQICGSEMSLYYIYLNTTLVNKINKQFNLQLDTNTSLYDAYDLMVQKKGEKAVKLFLINEFELDSKYIASEGELLIDACEQTCRVEKKSKKLGPGAMSNFPDRFDGFHSYNRCCRSVEDKGRHADNLKTYTKDRRAYEYWSDGNICSANGFMGSSYFNEASADHTGPISLGFVHDSAYLKKMPQGDNSSKRDKLLFDDVLKVIKIEEETGIRAISWFSNEIWSFLKKQVSEKKITGDGTKLENVRLMFKQSMSDYMFILKTIKSSSNGVDYLTTTYISPKMKDFQFDYEWDAAGRIVSKTPRTINDANRKEFDRMKRICLDSLDDYESKSNRNVKHDLTLQEKNELTKICNQVSSKNYQGAKQSVEYLIKTIERRIIQKYQ